MIYPQDYLNKIICGDCLEVMKDIPDKSVDLTVTSPPYDNLRDYGNDPLNFEDIASELFRVTKNGGVVVWVVGDSVVGRSETGSSFRQALRFMQKGFLIHDTMIYQKNGFSFPERLRYYQSFEYMFVFAKTSSPKTFNPIKIKTIKGDSKLSLTKREIDGSLTNLKHVMGKIDRIKDNIWKYEVGYMKSTKDKVAYKHPALFPEKLASDHIESWSNEGDLVLDPMCGSGTTLKMARKLGRNFIGIEINPDYCKIAEQRLAQTELFTPEYETKVEQSEIDL